jgi:hypothetical protein
MSVIQPASARHQADFLGGQFVIVIPSRKQWLQIPFFAIWLVFWFVGWTSAASELFMYPSGPDGFLAIWLIGWTAAGIYAASTLFWMLFGQDRVEITPDSLHVRRQIAGIGHTKSFDLMAISDLRVVQYPAVRSSWHNNRNNVSTVWKLDGPITFDYGAKTYHFGDGVDEAEAKQIVTRIQQQFPTLL